MNWGVLSKLDINCPYSTDLKSVDILPAMNIKKNIFIISILVFLGSVLVLFPYHPNQISHSDEGFYVETPREMIEGGNYLVPYYHGQLRFQKPVFYYWAVAAAYNIFGRSEQTARFTSTFFAALTVLLIFLSLSHFSSIRTALLAVVGVISTYGFFFFSHFATTDITLNFFISAGLLLYWHIITSKIKSIFSIWLFFALLGFAFLTKGPPGIVIPIVTIFLYLIFSKEPKSIAPLKYFSGWWIFLAISLPWFLILFNIFGKDYLNFFLITETSTRFSGNQKGIIYLLASYSLLLLPWTLFIPTLILCKIKLKNNFHKYLAAWILSPILIYLFIPNKHSHYILPSVVPSIILISLLAFDIKNKIVFKKALGIISVTSIILMLLLNTLLIPAILRRPEDGYAFKIKKEPFSKVIAFRWHSKRLLHILDKNRVAFAASTYDLERESIWPGPLYVVVDKSEYMKHLHSKREDYVIVRRKPCWKKGIKTFEVFKIITRGNFDSLRSEVFLLRRV